MLAQIGTDADRNGVPDVLEGKGSLPGLPKSSITVNGRTVDNVKDLPLPVRWLLTYMVRQVAKRAGGRHRRRQMLRCSGSSMRPRACWERSCTRFRPSWARGSPRSGSG